MPRQTANRHVKKPRSSLKYCGEHSACPRDKPDIAKYHCNKCKTFQCANCCSELHLALANHDPVQLDTVDPQLLCDRRNCSNFADYFCSSCQGGSQICCKCDEKSHRGLTYSHKRIEFELHRRQLKEQEERVKADLSRLELSVHDQGNISNPSSVYSDVESFGFEEPESSFKTVQQFPINCEKRSSPSESHKLTEQTRQEWYCSPQRSHNNLERNLSSDHSLEDQFFTIREDNLPSASPEMRTNHGTGSRGRVPKPERQNANDSSVMRTLDSESYGPMVDSPRSLHLIDNEENLLVRDAEEFLNRLELRKEDHVKVVSIFGNTGVGKSYTLNTVFFRGMEVFATSPSQDSCTYGVWAAYDCRLQCLVIDTEGFLGQTANEARRRRLLLKVLGISDVVIYRTTAARLETDMFYFLHDASKAFEDYFAAEFEAISRKASFEMPVTSMSPAIIIFHETTHTKPLPNESKALEELNKRAKDMKLSLSAFPGLKYVGIRTDKSQETDFKPLEQVLKQALQDTSHCLRIQREARVVYEVLSQLNKKYSGDIPIEDVVAFSSKYFSCQTQCKACGQRCQLSLNHEEKQHQCKEGCKYRAELGNRVFICRKCMHDGREQLVRWQTSTSDESGVMSMMMFLKRGYIIHCPTHGVIYKSFEQWYNNPPPEANATTLRIVHVWPGDIPLSADGTPGHMGQRIIDMGNSVTQVVSPSLQVASEWISDQVAPEYWTPNANARHCKVCRVEFGEKLPKHHCRRCGECVCEHCSPHTMHLPAWGARPVRVCISCKERPLSGQSSGSHDEEESEGKMRCERMVADNLRENSSSDVALADGSSGKDAANDQQLQVTARVMTEKVGQAAGIFSTVLKHSAGWVKEWVRPDYWKPDSELIKCAICEVPFGPTEDKQLQLKHGPEVSRHHCRRCGDGFCTTCSSQRLPVPSRGWESPVRVCDRCSKAPSPL